MKKNIKKITFILMLPIFLVILTAGGGSGSGGGKGGKDSRGGKTFDPGSTPPTNVCGTQTSKLILYQGNLKPNAIPNRLGAYSSFQPSTNNVFNGGKSELNIYNNTSNNFCSITITATNCSSYGTAGSKTFIWDSSNDGNSYDSSMNITIPNSNSFTIKITLYEGSGSFYTGYYSYGRAVWTHEKTYFPTPTISVNDWKFSRVVTN